MNKIFGINLNNTVNVHVILSGLIQCVTLHLKKPQKEAVHIEAINKMIE